MSSRKKLLIAFLLMAVLCAGVVAMWRRKSPRTPEAKGAEPAAATSSSETDPARQEIPPNRAPAHAYDAQGRLIPEAELRRAREYRLGRTLGQCLTQDCSVFSGTILAIGPPVKEAGEPDDWAITYSEVQVAVEQSVWGDRQLGPEVQLKHAASPLMTKTAIGPWSVWEGVELKVGNTLFVALWGDKAQRPVWKDQPERIAFVASDAQFADSARAAVRLHERVTRSPAELAQTPQTLRANPNSLLAGYIIFYLSTAGVAHDADQAARLLSSMLGMEGFAQKAQHDIATELTSQFHRVSQETRSLVANSLISAAGSDDPNLSLFALEALIRLSDDKALDLRSLLNAERRSKLVENYRAALAKGVIEKGHVAFETQLGLKPSR